MAKKKSKKKELKEKDEKDSNLQQCKSCKKSYKSILKHLTHSTSCKNDYSDDDLKILRHSALKRKNKVRAKWQREAYSLEKAEFLKYFEESKFAKKVESKVDLDYEPVINSESELESDSEWAPKKKSDKKVKKKNSQYVCQGKKELKPENFYHKSKFTSRVITDDGKKKYKCDICNHEFGRNHHLVRHFITKHKKVY